MIVKFLIFFSVVQIGSTASLADQNHERFPEDFCEKYDLYLPTLKSCFLLNGTNMQSHKYHEIICMNPSEEALFWSLEVYAKQECKRPLRLYITELRFNPDPAIFESVAGHLATLIIKSWNPLENSDSHTKHSVDSEGRFYLKGQPFLHLKHVKHLDIAFVAGAQFNSIPSGFFKGLDSLEALVIENLPRGSSIALGTFLPLNLLKCITLLGSTIPCSCQTEDHPSNRAHWLHQWLHHHSHLWSSQDFQKLVTYQDGETGEGRPFQCKVKVDCEVTTEDPSEKLLIDFHNFHFHQKCPLTSTTIATTTTTQTPEPTTESEVMLDDAPPCESLDSFDNQAASRKARNNNSQLPDGRVLCREGPGNTEPLFQESRSSAPLRNAGHLLLVAVTFCMYSGM